LAAAALAGISPESFLRSNDEIELQALILVANNAIKRAQDQRKEQAALIINYLSKALGGKKSGGE
jgi:hypothetical protein